MASDCQISIEAENRKPENGQLNGLMYDSYKYQHDTLSKPHEFRSVLQNVRPAESASTAQADFEQFEMADLEFRFAGPNDKPTMQKLCEELFPVRYPESWFDEIYAADSRFFTLLGVYRSEVVAFLVAELKPRSRMASEDMDMVDSELSYCCASNAENGDSDTSHYQWVLAASERAESSSESMNSRSNLRAEVRVTYLLSLGVVAALRRRGVASLILQRLLDHLNEPAQSDCRCVYLHVLATNRAAIRFYEQRFAFRKHAFLANYYSVRNAPAHGYSYVLYVNGGRPPRGCVAQLCDAVRALRRRYTLASRFALRVACAPFVCARRLLAHSFGTVFALRASKRRPLV